MARKPGWIGGHPTQHEVDEARSLSRQLDQVTKDGIERRKREQMDALVALAQMRCDLLELAGQMGLEASECERSGQYELAESLRVHIQTLNYIRTRPPKKGHI